MRRIRSNLPGFDHDRHRATLRLPVDQLRKFSTDVHKELSVNAPDGTAASLLVNELAAEAEAVYGVELAGPLDDLVQSIPAGAAFDSPEARRAFGRFVLELIERVGRPALGD